MLETIKVVIDLGDDYRTSYSEQTLHWTIRERKICIEVVAQSTRDLYNMTGNYDCGEKKIK